MSTNEVFYLYSLYRERRIYVSRPKRRLLHSKLRILCFGLGNLLRSPTFALCRCRWFNRLLWPSALALWRNCRLRGNDLWNYCQSTITIATTGSDNLEPDDVA